MKRKSSRRRMEVNVEELDGIIDAAMRAPLSAADGQTLKTAVHAMAERLVRRRSTEKTSAVLETLSGSGKAKPEVPSGTDKPDPAGHGRNGAAAFTGAQRGTTDNAMLVAGDPCPGCGQGRGGGRAPGPPARATASRRSGSWWR